MDGSREISNFLGKDPTSEVFVKQRVTENSKKSQRAESGFIPLATKNGYTFALVLTKTGRKHQIRVHAQSIGHPLIGEKLYGRDETYYLRFCEGGWKNEWMEDLGMSRQALHGRSLGFIADDFYYKADLALDMRDFLFEKMGFSEAEINAMQAKGDETARIWWMKELSCADAGE